LLQKKSSHNRLSTEECIAFPQARWVSARRSPGTFYENEEPPKLCLASGSGVGFARQRNDFIRSVAKATGGATRQKKGSKNES
jgi:hypothetical protein